MNDIQELYQELIIDHAKAPKNFGTLVQCTHRALGHNPLCGDSLRVQLHIENETIKDIAFEGEGCAISKASASLMTESIKGLSLHAARDLFMKFHTMLTEFHEDHGVSGKLAVLSGVRQFPMRVKCATLCWHTFDAAVNKSSSVTTE